MQIATAVWPLVIFLALLMGFVADRTHLCSVHAVKEVLFERRARLLLSFVKTVLWVLATSLLLASLLATPAASSHSFQFSFTGLLGGLLFGFGSVLNDGCSLHTLTRLGRGNLGMVVSIVGLVIGAIICKALFLQAPALVPALTDNAAGIDAAQRQILLWVLGIWVVVETFRILRRFNFRECRRNIMAAEYGLSPAAALLGIANGVLFVVAGTWMYTYTLIQGTSNFLFTDTAFYRPVPALLWWLLLAYLVGIVASAISHHSLAVTIKPRLSWLRYFSGGILMGFGASMVPGGNDVLLLNSIPGLSAHAIPAYLAMLAGIGIALLMQQRYLAARQ
jgi:uncharacterized membrane protein YedE/YeeE